VDQSCRRQPITSRTLAILAVTLDDTHALVVLIGGAPATGKTTLSLGLASKLRLPLVSKDRIKEAVMDSMDVPDVHASERAGALAFDLLWRFTDWLLESRSSLILEANFTSRAIPALERIRDRSQLVQLTCVCPEEISDRRYADRAQSPDRHPGHHDALRMQRGHPPSSSVGPFELGVATLVINTSDGYEPSLQQIVEFIGRADQQRGTRPGRTVVS
jgi:predicted kinase